MFSFGAYSRFGRLLRSLDSVCKPLLNHSEVFSVDPKNVPRALPTDQIEVYYMAAPLLYCTNLNEFTHVNGYHGGVGIVNKCVFIETSLTLKAFPTENFSFVSRFPLFSRRLLAHHHKGTRSESSEEFTSKLANGTHALTWHNLGTKFILTANSDREDFHL